MRERQCGVKEEREVGGKGEGVEGDSTRQPHLNNGKIWTCNGQDDDV
jgi:hypothetical protein